MSFISVKIFPKIYVVFCHKWLFVEKEYKTLSTKRIEQDWIPILKRDLSWNYGVSGLHI